MIATLSFKNLKVMYLCILCLLVYTSNSFSQTTWEWRNPLPVGENLNSIAYGDSLSGNKEMFVAVGEAGMVISSGDGDIWSKDSSVTISDLMSVTYGNKKFVAVGQGGTIITSTDGLTWKTEKSYIMDDLYSVTYGAGQFIAVGKGGKILSSTDGSTWYGLESFMVNTFNWYFGVTFASNLSGGQADKFVAVGWDMQNQTGIRYSTTDGIAWNSLDLHIKTTPFAITYSKISGLFVMGCDSGKILTSTDATTWTERISGSTSAIRSVSFGEGKFVAVDGSNILISTNGIDWVIKNCGSSYQLNSALFQNSKYLVVGARGTIISSTNSDDWKFISSGFRHKLRSVTYGTTNLTSGNGVYLAAGDSGIILSSEDGTSWTVRNSGIKTRLNCVNYFDPLFLAVGDSGVILKSSDAINWNKLNSGTTKRIRSITFGKLIPGQRGEYVAVGDSGLILKSIDCNTWQSVFTSTSANLLSIASSKQSESDTGRIFATGSNGTLLMFTEFTNPFIITFPNLYTIEFVMYGNNKFLASAGGTLLSLTKTTSWNQQQWKDTSMSLFSPSAIAYGDSQYVLVGQNNHTNGISKNGTTWVRSENGTNAYLNAITYGKDLFVAVGDDGAILISKTKNYTTGIKTSKIQSVSSKQIASVVNGNISITLPESFQNRQLSFYGYDISGKLIFSKPVFKNSNMVGISSLGLPSGRYFFEVRGDNKTIWSSSLLLVK